MGIYLNPGSNAYEEALASQIYVDKTEMISYINTVVKTKQKYVCVSRPRRFGKTMAADMLCAYYDKNTDSRRLFSKREISKIIGWDQYLNQFDVIRINIIDFLIGSSSIKEMISFLTEEIASELMQQYSDTEYGSRISLRTIMARIYAQKQIQFIIIIDEWDAVFRERKLDTEGQKAYLDFLRDWLKDKEYVALAYMTGILPIKKYGVHSALNMFDEYSMAYPLQLAQYTGFTEDEVKNLCQQYGRDYRQLKEWYDGYQVRDAVPPETQNGTQSGEAQIGGPISLYSPLSVVKAIRSGTIQNYWNATESYDALNDYISMNYDGLREFISVLMNGGRRKVDITTYQNDMTTFHGKDDILTLLIHLGYLGYDSLTKEVFIPNKEILDVFKSSTRTERWTVSFESLRNSQRLLKAIWNSDADLVAKLIEEAHLKAGTDGYHSEAGLSYGLQLALYAAENYYSVFRELASGKGFVDLTYIPRPEHANIPALVVELKYDKDADTAIKQIHRQQYLERIEAYKGNILLVGVNYDRDVSNEDPSFKHHTCIIEKA